MTVIHYLLFFTYIHPRKGNAKGSSKGIMIDRCINKLKRGKAAGMDGLNVEHLMFAHPIIVQQLAQLF